MPESSNEQDRDTLPQQEQTMSSMNSAIGFRGFMSEAALHGMRGLKKLFNVVIWIPTDLTLSMTKGFHNVPKLYHDVTVQPSPNVTGFRSGLRAARTVCLFFAIFRFFSYPMHVVRLRSNFYHRNSRTVSTMVSQGSSLSPVMASKPTEGRGWPRELEKASVGL